MKRSKIDALVRLTKSWLYSHMKEVEIADEYKV
jgi:hypothetical protein